MVYTRKMTPTERVYLIYNHLCPPFANQMILEGSGNLDLAAWTHAVEKASEANPGSRVIMKGHGPLSRWVDTGIRPGVRQADGSSWDGLGPEGAPFLETKLSPVKGPSCEVVLIQGSTPRVAFRTHHGAMDARGTMVWAQDIFRILRGEAPAGSSSRITEQQLARSYQKTGRRPPKHQFIAPTGQADVRSRGITWKRVTLNGRYSHLLGQIACIVANEAWKHRHGNIRIAVPVDMRFRSPGLLSTGNLTNLIYLDITEKSTPEQVSADISTQLENRCDGMQYRGDNLVRYMPLWFLKYLFCRETVDKYRNGFFRNSGIISNPGRLPLDSFHGDSFICKTGFFIPPGVESLPFFIALAGTHEKVELALSLPIALASKGRLEGLLKRLERDLQARTSS